MKYLQFIVLASLCALLIYSCKDEAPPEPAYKSIAINSMEATVGEDSFASSSVTASRFETEFIKINASAVTAGISFVLTDHAEGDYLVGGLENSNAMEYSNVMSDQGSISLVVYTSSQKAGASGTISILERDIENQTISGSFSGTIVLDTDDSKTINIENGLFHQVPY